MSAIEIEIEIPEGISERLDKALASLAPNHAALSRSRIQELIQSGRVFQEGSAILNAKHKAQAGDVYRLNIPEPAPSEIEAQNIPLDIVYEDDHLIVVNKPAGMVVHPAAGSPRDTLVNALLFHARDSLSGIGGVERPGIVHRIDKDTSGLLVVAKNDRAHEGLGQQFRDHSIERLYAAFAYGALKPSPRILGLEGVSKEGRNELRIDHAIGRHKTDRLKMAPRPDGRHAISHIRLEGYDAHETMSRVECQLETGRTHQIRVHLNMIGHPLLGDPLYGKGARQLPKSAPDELREAIDALEGQALHAKSLGFLHPITGDRLHFEAPMPADMQRLEDMIVTNKGIKRG